jgi:ABC-type transporter Mla subunit MlaD
LWSLATAVRYQALFSEAGGLTAGNIVTVSGSKSAPCRTSLCTRVTRGRATAVMMHTTIAHRLVAQACGVAVTVTGYAFQGVNSLPLPGAVGRGSGSSVYHVKRANAVTLESNSPVMIDDVVVGSAAR